MLRTNLLLDRDDMVVMFGQRVSRDTVRYALVFAVVTFAIIIFVVGLQAERIASLWAQQRYFIAQDHTLAPMLTRAEDVGMAVLHLQQVTDAAATARASGNARAVEIAVLGSNIRRTGNTWLAAIHSTSDGWELLGVSSSVADLSRAALAIDRTSLFSLVSAQSRGATLNYDAFVQQRAAP